MAISTRLHGLIDYAAAISLGGLVLGGALSRRSQRVAAVATAVPVGCFLATDFEGGLVRWVGMRRHLEFDVAWGALLCGAGLLMRREPPASRAILAFYGLSQFALGLSTDSKPASRPGQGSGPIERLLGPARPTTGRERRRVLGPAPRPARSRTAA